MVYAAARSEPMSMLAKLYIALAAFGMLMLTPVAASIYAAFMIGGGMLLFAPIAVLFDYLQHTPWQELIAVGSAVVVFAIAALVLVKPNRDLLLRTVAWIALIPLTQAVFVLGACRANGRSLSACFAPVLG